MPILLAGVLGGMFWAAIAAWLRDKFNASEILVTLMLVYVAVQVLNWLVYGPWKDPDGYNFPQTVVFAASTKMPRLIDGLRANIGVLIAQGLQQLGKVFAGMFAHTQKQGDNGESSEEGSQGASERMALNQIQRTLDLLKGARMIRCVGTKDGINIYKRVVKET